MDRRGLVVTIAFLAVLVSCASSRRNKNDEIAACTASGGRWSEGGCNGTGRCEHSSGTVAPEREPDDGEDRPPWWDDLPVEGDGGDAGNQGT